MLRQESLSPSMLILALWIGLSASFANLALADERSDYQVLCDIWRKSNPDGTHEKQPISREERALLLRELVGRRVGIAPHDFRRMAAITLGNIRAAEAVDRIVDRLKDPGEDNMVSAEAAVALGKIGEPKALAPLLDALLDDRPFIRTHAAQGLRLLKPGEEQIASVASVEKFEALLDKAEGLPLPQSEREWLDSDSTSSNLAYQTARQVDALCTGLELGRPKKLPDKDVARVEKLAAKVLAAGFPAEAFRSEVMLPNMREFCQAAQPELFAKKVTLR